MKQNKYYFLMIYLLLLIPFLCLYLGGYYFLLLPLTVFVFMPLVDAFVRDDYNLTEAMAQSRLKDKFYHNLLVSYLPFHIALIIGCMVYIHIYHVIGIELVLISIMVGTITGGVGINISHELMHKPNKTDQIVSRILLAMVCYGHFVIEHVRGHHLNVATLKDPATARLNESIYHFFPRVVRGSWCSAWSLESRRLNRAGLSIYNIKNEFYWIVISPLCLAILAFFIAGWAGVLYFFLQSFVAIYILEVVNYIEHYGLMRRKDANGNYEPVNPQYSWDADQWLSNHILFNLMRHADHHTFAAKPYQNLRISQESPKLPASYATLYWLVIIPPLWFKVMNHQLTSYQNQQVE